jgi:hypothetical protein
MDPAAAAADLIYFDETKQVKSSMSSSSDPLDVIDDFSGVVPYSTSQAQLIMHAASSFSNPKSIFIPLSTGVYCSASVNPATVVAEFLASSNCSLNMFLIAQDVDISELTFDEAGYPGGTVLFDDPAHYAGPYTVGYCSGSVGSTVDEEGAGYLDNINLISSAGNNFALGYSFEPIADKTFYSILLYSASTAGTLPNGCTINSGVGGCTITDIAEASNRPRPYIVPSTFSAVWPA